MNKNKNLGGPSSALGIMRFFDSDSLAPKISPEFIVIVTVVFIAGMLLWHAFA